MFVQDLYYLIEPNTPCIYLGARGEIILYITGVKTINGGKYYEFTCILEESIGRTISAWYGEFEVLADFVLIDWFPVPNSP